MNENNNKTIKIVCAVLGVAVVALLVVVAFMLGQRSGNNGNGGQTTPTAPGATEQTPDESAAPTPASDAVPGEDGQEATKPADGPYASVRDLDVDMTTGTLTFKAGDAFGVDYDSSVISVTVSDECMIIGNAVSDPTAAQRRKMDVTITVPESFTFGDVDLSLGAGKLNAQTLSAETLELEFGAGSANFSKLTVTGSAKIQEGAGELSINGGSINNLNLQCGAGASNVSAKLTGTNNITAAFGAVNLHFEGNEADYTVNFQMGIGTCIYNGSKISRSGTFGEGDTLVNITGGFGIMHVDVG